jgi:hypothetical protein
VGRERVKGKDSKRRRGFKYTYTKSSLPKKGKGIGYGNIMDGVNLFNMYLFD